jgi:hypothetical protein
MARATNQAFLAIRTEGLMLPPELLQRVADLDAELPGLAGTDFHLAEGERLNEAVNRSWNRLVGLWPRFRAEIDAAGAEDALIGSTRERWLLPLYQELGYGRLQRRTALEIEGKSYPISHIWQASPIHLVGAGLDIDKRTAGQAGAARSSPHSLVQEFLNRSDAHLWGFVSNGLKLRILRDNISLTRQAYVEFDLAVIMAGELYADFRLLWLLCHQSRVEAERPESCYLEQWYNEAKQQGTRALDQLRDGVESAITALGSGFLAHRANTSLQERLASGELSTQDYYRQILRLVYRLIFLFVSEDRDLLLAPDASDRARQRYTSHYSTKRLRRIAGQLRGNRHDDLYEALKLIMAKLDREGCSELGIAPLGSFLWSPDSIVDIATAQIANRDLLEAVRALAFIKRGGALRQIDYRNLGPEELGGVYEGLLELHPKMHRESATFNLGTAAGHERKTTGSYYTPDSLVQCLLDSALEPIMDDAEAGKLGEESAKALLSLTVCDPAVGSGHFLIAAAHRIARRVAAARTGDAEPSPADTRESLRDVIGHCLYGVDLNPMSAELCRVSLWLEAMEPGKPLSFLDHHIQVGNSLFGTTPELIARGLPDEAYKPIVGDDRPICTVLKRKNSQERDSGQRDMLNLMVAEPRAEYDVLAAASEAIDDSPNRQLEDVARKETQFQELLGSPEYEKAKILSDVWCAAFVWPKTEESVEAITTDVIRRIDNDNDALSPQQSKVLKQLTRQHQFFHWNLAFPDVFANGGFDCVLGNPPWDQIQFREQEFFSERAPDIAVARSAAARKRLIAELPESNPTLYQDYLEAEREVAATRAFVQGSGNFPTTARGRMNLFALFAELSLNRINENGRVGAIVPSGIVSDDTTKYFFQTVSENAQLASFYDFENRKGLFPSVDSRMKFALMTLNGSAVGASSKADFAFYLHGVSGLAEPDRVFSVSAEEISLLNPNTKTMCAFRTRREADITIGIHRRAPVLLHEEEDVDDRWGITTRPGLFNMAGDSERFLDKAYFDGIETTRDGNNYQTETDRFLPLYEGKMFSHFDHRAADVVISSTAALRQGQSSPVSDEDHLDPNRLSTPRYWVEKEQVEAAIGSSWDRPWFLVWKEITSPTNERTLIPCILPPVAIGHKCPLILPDSQYRDLTLCLSANLSSLILDFVVRQKLGTTSLTPFTLKQLPVLPPSYFERSCVWAHNQTIAQWILDRHIELTYTAWDLEEFGNDMSGSSSPYRWDSARRKTLQNELDAAFFAFYEIERDDVDFILEAFPIIRRKDEADHGEYVTKYVILDIYDEMQQSMNTAHQYQTRLDPPPGDLSRCHPHRDVDQC